MAYRICIIVDNPLRDLDGLALVAWHLSNMGAEVYLVPMYTQVSDIRAISPDFVLVNYVRPNNIDTLKLFKSWGMVVGVLDTEGVSGKNPDDLAKLVQKVDAKSVVDLYCLWGEKQYRSFVKYDILPSSKMSVSGCPRYDFCTEGLNQALSEVDLYDYVLVNTNFPTANPRFTKGPEEEVCTMIKVGFDEDFAKRFVHDAQKTHRKIVDILRETVHRFPSQNFVIRPHPFESIHAYDELAQEENVFVKQQRTSLEWINSSICLVHLNCSTSVEAFMLGKIALSLEWLNTPALTVPMAKQMSIEMDSKESFYSTLSSILQRKQTYNKTNPAQKEVIDTLYAGNDGKASERVANLIFATLRSKKHALGFDIRTFVVSLGNYSMVSLLHRILGYNKYIVLRNAVRKKSGAKVKDEKFFSQDEVKNVLDRINIVFQNNSIIASEVALNTRYRRLYSGKSVKVVQKEEGSEC